MGSWFNETYPERANPDYVGLQIPTMEEILDRYGNETRYYIEIKTFTADSGMEQPLIDLLDRYELVDGTAESRQVYVQSFDPETLRMVHSIAPQLPLVQLFIVGTAPSDEAGFDRVAEYAVGIGTSSSDTNAALVAAAHDRCIALHPSTVDDPEDMTRLLDADVDGIFTNTPGILREEVGTRPSPLASCTPSESDE